MTVSSPIGWRNKILIPIARNFWKLGREIYKTFFKKFKDLPTAKYKVEHWDAGWWQIKRCLVEGGLEDGRLKEIEELKKRLGEKICDEALGVGMISSA